MGQGVASNMKDSLSSACWDRLWPTTSSACCHCPFTSRCLLWSAFINGILFDWRCYQLLFCSFLLLFSVFCMHDWTNTASEMCMWPHMHAHTHTHPLSLYCLSFFAVPAFSSFFIHSVQISFSFAVFFPCHLDFVFPLLFSWSACPLENSNWFSTWVISRASQQWNKMEVLFRKGVWEIKNISKKREKKSFDPTVYITCALVRIFASMAWN